MALTTYNITGNLEDAFGAKALLGEVTFTPAGATKDARVDGADAMLGPIRYSIADLPSPMPLTEGAWVIAIHPTGRVNGEAQFRTKTIPWNMTAATTWGAIVTSAADPVPLPAPTFDESVAGVLGTGGQTDTALRETFATKGELADATVADLPTYGALTMPAGFPALPTTFYRDNDGVIRHGFDFASYYASPVGTTTIYVGLTGSDTTGNGSQATPYRTLQKAMADVAAGGGTQYNVIIVDVPYFNRDEAGFSGTITGKTVSIRSQYTKRTLVTSSSVYTWTADGVGTYKATRSGVVGVADSGKPDHNGLPVALKSVASVAACQAEAGTFYADATTVWVHRLDGALPVNTADTVVTIGTTAFDPILAGGSKLYVENLTFLGWVGGNGLRVRGSDTSTTDEFVAYDCGFVGNTGNGYTTDRVAKTYVFNCQSGYQDKDGFNYSYFPMTRAHVRANCLAVEYNCTAYELGINNPGEGSNNTSTAHSAANVLRIGHVGYRNAGVTIHDVNGCRSVLYDCNVRTPVVGGVAGDGTCYSFTADNATDVGEAWLVNCTAQDADTALVVGSNTTVHLTRFQTPLPIVNGGTLV